MTHGKNDDTVYFSQAEGFAESQNAAGGNVEFISTTGNHTQGGIPFYLKLYTVLNDYK